MPTPREEAEALIRALPEDASYDELQYRLYVAQRIRQGLDAAAAGEVLPHDVVKARLAAWRRG